jgi:hypothetical protein
MIALSAGDRRVCLLCGKREYEIHWTWDACEHHVVAEAVARIHLAIQSIRGG